MHHFRHALMTLALGLAITGVAGCGSASTSTDNAPTAKASATSKPTAKATAKPAPKATPKPTAKPTPKPTPKPTVAHFGDGTFQVGKDIQPGTYRTRTGSSNCYYERLKGFSGSIDDIIANQNTSAPAIVSIASNDKGFTSTGCGTWTKDLSQITKSKTSFGDGMYIVNTDITPGTYRNSGGDNCYYARLSGFSNNIDSIIANNNVSNPTIVTIASSDAGFESRGCGTWTKQ